ncbi:MAG TPA: hypothetical protein VGF88_14250 [Acidobacteriaceae bacterium]|jgi:hypothetical protein
MHFSLFANINWAAGFILNLLLFAVLVGRGRWREFPILTSWMVFLTLRSIVLFEIHRQPNSRNLYADVWVTGTWVEFFLQLAVVLEIARIVLRPTASWARDARAQFISAGLAGAAIAAIVAWLVSPPAWSAAYAWQMRGDLFTSLVICELFVAMTLTATRLGLGWRNHVMAVGQGLTAWSTVMVLATACQSFFGTQRFYIPLEDVRIVTYIVAAIWMILQLWRDEPERRPIAPDLHEYILALHRRVEYDLRRLDARQ